MFWMTQASLAPAPGLTNTSSGWLRNLCWPPDIRSCTLDAWSGYYLRDCKDKIHKTCGILRFDKYIYVLYQVILKSNGSHLYMNFSFCTVVKDKPFSRADKIDQTASFIIIRHPAPEPVLRVSSPAIKLENQSYLGNTVSVPHVAINSFYVIPVHNNGQQMLLWVPTFFWPP